MMAIAILDRVIHRQFTLSDLIVLPIIGMLSFAGVAVLMVVLFCHGIEIVLEETGNNKVLWER